MTLANVSQRQALSVWSELEQAYYGDNGYGSDTAEIYAYRLMPNMPAGLGRDNPYARVEMLSAARALYELLSLFCDARACKCTIDGERLGEWVAFQPFEHRYHVRILHPSPT